MVDHHGDLAIITGQITGPSGVGGRHSHHDEVNSITSMFSQYKDNHQRHRIEVGGVDIGAASRADASVTTVGALLHNVTHSVHADSQNTPSPPAAEQGLASFIVVAVVACGLAYVAYQLFLARRKKPALPDEVPLLHSRTYIHVCMHSHAQAVQVCACVHVSICARIREVLVATP